MSKTEQEIQRLHDEVEIGDLELHIASTKARISALNAICVGIAAECAEAEREENSRRLCNGYISSAYRPPSAGLGVAAELSVT